MELVVAALTAGASAGLTETASSAVRDAYAGLREAVRRRLARRSEDDALVLAAHEAEPGVWEARLARVAARADDLRQAGELAAQAAAVARAHRGGPPRHRLARPGRGS
ncbi:hypothetical protein ABT095_20960 [Kitasatospora sp. NPDC002227]|uniref:hypothetical protein n=1 Tax=Kitasatospora sp. NPDC002227 TaxID=3154773 RepID=UPI00332ACC1A